MNQMNTHNSTRTDGACPVSTTPLRTLRGLRGAGGLLGLLICLLLACMPKTALAADAATLANAINTYGGGAISALASGNTVTVTGTRTNVTVRLPLNIDGGVLVIWQGSLTGSTATSLIAVEGTGTFTVASGGKIEQTGQGMAIDVTSAATVNISGTVSATNTQGVAIRNNSSGTVTISSGTVSSAEDIAIRNASTGTVTVSGGTVTATTGAAIYNNSQGVINVSGGTVQNTGNGHAIINKSIGSISVLSGMNKIDLFFTEKLYFCTQNI